MKFETRSVTCYNRSNRRNLNKENLLATTTVPIDDSLNARITAAAALSGKSADVFILEAITQRVEQVELDEALHRDADERWVKIRATGETVPWDAAKTWLEAVARGENPPKPEARVTDAFKHEG